MAHRISSRLLVTFLAVALLLTAVPAFAATPPNTTPKPPGSSPNPLPSLPSRGSIPARVTVAGRDISGLSESKARAVIAAAVKPTAFAPLTIKAADQTYTFGPTGLFYTDVDAMLRQAYTASGVNTLAVDPKFAVDPRQVTPFVGVVAYKTDRTSVDSRWELADRSLTLTPSRTTRVTDQAAGVRSIYYYLKREAAMRGTAQPVITIPVAETPAAVNEDNIGRAILVVLGTTHLYLYDRGAVIRDYRCAIGQPEYPTPTGQFIIELKRYMPTWVNPGSGWAGGMPPYIGPGPNNPLGTRALNLNADGIRIHGTSNIGSIGTPASHGCVRLVRENIEELYDMVVVGTPVYIVH